MLTGYFDDSGTHDKTDKKGVVLVAGILGTEWQLGTLEALWKKELAAPLCGRKKYVQRLHMFHCNQSLGEFGGWTRTETDHFLHRLQDIIFSSHVGAYGVAVARADWDELVVGNVRGTLGDAEEYCISQCFVSALRWARTNTFDPQITFVFDSRSKEIERRAQAIGNAFEIHSTSPEVVGTAFLSSYKVRPLQAADMIAWELYQHAKDILRNGMKSAERPQLRRLYKNMYFDVQIAQRDQIKKIVELTERQGAERLSEYTKHFAAFDPANPDYSFLSGAKK
jgi:hypothetical protein